MSVQPLSLLEQITGLKWKGVTFHKKDTLDAFSSLVQPIRFCTAIAEAEGKTFVLKPDCVCCEGARRCFGWLHDQDERLAINLAEKTGLGADIAYTIIQQISVLNEDITAVSVGDSLQPDVLITYAQPVAVMHIIRFLQSLNGKSIPVGLSSVMAVCGNVAVRSFLAGDLSISFGCPDSREYGGIGPDQIVVGLPFKMIQNLADGQFIRS